MSRVRPALAFELAVTHFLLSAGKDRDRLTPAIDAYRASTEWKAAGTYTKQLVTACERAVACAPIDLAKAVEGVQEIADLARRERNAAPAWEDELKHALPRKEPELALPEDPPHTRWDERADLQ